MIYKIKKRKWYGIEEFGGAIIFTTGDSAAQLAALQKSFTEMNIQLLEFTKRMQEFNTAVGSATGLANLIRALEEVTAKQAKAAAATKDGTKAGLDAQNVIDQRIKTTLNYNNVLNKNAQLQRTVTAGLDAEGRAIKVAADAEGKLLSIRERQVITTEARLRAEAKLQAQLGRAGNEFNRIQNIRNQGLLQGLQIQTKYNSVTGKSQEIWRATNIEGKKFAATITRVKGQVIGVASSLTPLNNNLTEAKNRTAQLTLSWQTFLRVVVVQVIHRAVSKFIQEIKRATEDAIEFSIRIAEIRTISQQNQLATDRWAGGLRDLSDAFGFDLLDQAEAAYQTLSNQVAKGAETFGFLKTANELALVGVSDSASAVQFLSAVQNAFNLTLDNTKTIAAQTFKTIELGRVRLDEMANTIGQSAVPAANLGLSFTDLAAAITTVTIRGVPFEKAQTAIRNILLKLIRPTAEMNKLFREWGVNSGEAAIETFGFAGVLAKIEERTKGSSTELGKIFGRIRAISGAMVFAGRGLRTFENNWKELANTQESYEKALKETLNNTGREIRIEVNKIKNYFTEDIGKELIEAIAYTNKHIISLSSMVKFFANIMTFTLVPAIGLAVMELKKLAVAAAANPYTALIAATVLVGETIKTVIDQGTSATENGIKEVEKAYEDTLKNLQDLTKKRIAIAQQGYKEELRLARQAVAEIQSELTKVEQNQIGLDKDIAQNLNIAYKGIIKSVQEGIKELDKIIKDSEKTIEQTTRNIADLQREFTSEQLSTQLKNAADVQAQQQILIAEAERRFIAAVAETGTGEEAQRNLRANFAEAKKLLDELSKLQESTAKKNESNEEEILSLQERKKRISQDISKERDKATNKQLDFEKKINDRIRAGAALSIIRSNGKLAKVQTQDPQALKAIRDQERFEKESNIRIEQLLKKQASITQIIKDRQPIELRQLNIMEAQKNLVEERIRVERELRDQAIAAAKAAEIEKSQREENLKTIREQFRAISDLRVKDVLGADTVEGQVANLLRAISKIEEARTTLRGTDVVDLQTQIAIEEQLTRKEEQLKTTLEAKLNEQRLKSVREAIKLQEEGLKNEAKKRYESQDEINRKLSSATSGVLDEYNKIFREGLLGKDKATLSALLQNPTKETAKALLNSLEQFRARILPGRFGTPQTTIEKTTLASKELIDQINRLVKINEESKTSQQNIEKYGVEGQKKLEESRKELEITFGTFATAEDKQNEHLAAIQKAQTVDIPNLLTQIRDKVGPLGRAAGGDVPGSTDTVPAMLTPGEFVMNAQSARKFHTQLVAMNAGIQPFQNGGDVTTVGDININMNSSGNESVDVTKIGKLLQRQIRRKTLRF